MKTLYDWRFYCTESYLCYVKLFNNDTGEEIFDGVLSEVPWEYLDYQVQSFDPVSEDEPYLCLNIGK